MCWIVAIDWGVVPMSEEKKKREAVYNPEADKRWSEKNPERRKYLSHRSRARSFIREVATAEDLQELKALIADREKQLEAE